MTIVGQKCCKRIYNQSYGGHACINMAKVEAEGKFYCGTHDPNRLAELNRKNREKWKAERLARNNAFDAQQKKFKSNEVKAGLLDEAVSIIKKQKVGGCWCPVGIGHPMYSNHAPQCIEIKNFMDKAEKL